ncbi:MAG: hypothetical protein WC858_05500 [Parcubacteria group bacterium]
MQSIAGGGRENGSFPGAEELKPQGFKERLPARRQETTFDFPASPPSSAVADFGGHSPLEAGKTKYMERCRSG